jgi:hypothetical protein
VNQFPWAVTALGAVAASVLTQAPPKYTLGPSELRAATVTMTRENRCGVGGFATDIRQCPTYTVTISGDGSVTYAGTSGVVTVGTRTHMVDETASQNLVRAFLDANFFGLQDRYVSISMGGGYTTVDHAVATTLSLEIGGRLKSVYDFYGTPGIVRDLERRVDEVTDSYRYTGRPPESGLRFLADTDALVIKAVIAERLWNEVRRQARPEDGPPMIALAPETLAVCHSEIVPAVPCFTETAILRAKSTAAARQWPPVFGVYYSSESASPTRLAAIDVAGVAVGPLHDLSVQYPHATAMAVATPMYLGDRAMLYVTFGGTEWLFLLSKTNGEWHVTDEAKV